jgi:hypothetical protein
MMTRLLVALAVVLLIVGLWLTRPEDTCPNYGEVPALIDGETVCVPWTTQP